jgi:hypothetical protein
VKKPTVRFALEVVFCIMIVLLVGWALRNDVAARWAAYPGEWGVRSNGR